MSKLDQIRSLPDVATLPVGFVKEALREQEEERVRLAVERQDTIHMWGEIAVRHNHERARAIASGREWQNETDDLGPTPAGRRE